jgi:plasmid stabilization system protein ParE
VQLIITETAKLGLRNIADYIESEFGLTLSIQIENEVYKSISFIHEHPFTWPLSKIKKGDVLRKMIVKQLTIITYQIDEANQVIYILDIFDARTNWK